MKELNEYTREFLFAEQTNPQSAVAYSSPFCRKTEALQDIADGIGATVVNTGNRDADILEAIAKKAPAIGKDGGTPIVGAASWKDVRRNVKMGRGPTLYPVHSILNVQHEVFGNIAFEVVAHNGETISTGGGGTKSGSLKVSGSGDDSTVPTMTLLALDGIQQDETVETPMGEMHIGYEFDASEKICLCASGLPSGTYSAGESENGWSFTLTQAVPAGGYLSPEADMMSGEITSVCSYREDGSIIERVAVSQGATGTALSSVIAAEDMNDFDRCMYGSGNYAQSGIRQWLNGSGKGWWEAKTKFDMPPTYLNQEGFLGGLDPEFVAVLAETEQTVSTNNVYEQDMETESSYTVKDKIFLASYSQIGGNASGGQAAEGTLWTAFENLSTGPETARVKYRHGSIDTDEASSVFWWMRSPTPVDSPAARGVSQFGATGGLSIRRAYRRDGAVVPACVI